MFPVNACMISNKCFASEFKNIAQLHSLHSMTDFITLLAIHFPSVLSKILTSLKKSLSTLPEQYSPLCHSLYLIHTYFKNSSILYYKYSLTKCISNMMDEHKEKCLTIVIKGGERPDFCKKLKSSFEKNDWNHPLWASNFLRIIFN